MDYLATLLTFFTLMSDLPPGYADIRDPQTGVLNEKWAWFQSPIPRGSVDSETVVAQLEKALGPPMDLPAVMFARSGESPHEALRSQRGWLFKYQTVTEGGILLRLDSPTLVSGWWWRQRHVAYEKGHENDRMIEGYVRGLLTGSELDPKYEMYRKMMGQ